MMSAAAWGGGGGGGSGSGDSARIARAIDAVQDSVDHIDSLVQRHAAIATLDSAVREIRRRTGVRLEADSVAGGYALDRAGRVLATVADSALLTLGGQYLWIAPAGHSTRRPVGIPDPENSLRAIGTVELQNGSVRTKSRERADSARPVSVTVLASDALTADAWSSAFFEMGCDSALVLAPRLEPSRVSVVCADSSGVRWTPDLEQRVLLPRVPGGRGEPADQRRTRAAGRAGRAP